LHLERNAIARERPFTRGCLGWSRTTSQPRSRHQTHHHIGCAYLLGGCTGGLVGKLHLHDAVTVVVVQGAPALQKQAAGTFSHAPPSPANRNFHRPPSASKSARQREQILRELQTHTRDCPPYKQTCPRPLSLSPPPPRHNHLLALRRSTPAHHFNSNILRQL
jgi:hypothetical protein